MSNMKLFMRTVLLLLLIVGFSSCAHHPPAKLVVAVASILNDQNSEKITRKIMSVLDQAGIHDYSFAGSVRWCVFVRPEEKAEAARILKQDAEQHKYDMQFY